MRKSLFFALILLSCSLACPYANVSAADDTTKQKDTTIDPGAEDYWNMMAEKAEKEAKKDAEKKDTTTTQSGASKSK